MITDFQSATLMTKFPPGGIAFEAFAWHDHIGDRWVAVCIGIAAYGDTRFDAMANLVAEVRPALTELTGEDASGANITPREPVTMQKLKRSIERERSRTIKLERSRTGGQNDCEDQANRISR